MASIFDYNRSHVLSFDGERANSETAVNNFKKKAVKRLYATELDPVQKRESQG